MIDSSSWLVFGSGLVSNTSFEKPTLFAIKISKIELSKVKQLEGYLIVF